MRSAANTLTTHVKFVQVSFASLLALTLLLIHGTPFITNFILHHLTLSLSLSLAYISLLSLLLRRSSSRRRVYLLDYSCFKPAFDRKLSFEVCEYFVRRTRRFSLKSEEFMRGIYRKSGLGDETYGPPFIFESSSSNHKEEEEEEEGEEDAYLHSALQEAQEGMFSSIDSLLSKTHMSPHEIDIVIVTCGMFNPIPSLTSILVNKYKFKHDVKTYNLSGMGCSSGAMSIDLAANIVRSSSTTNKTLNALVVATESISQNWYFGDDRSMLVTNCIFRVGCAAAIVTNNNDSTMAKMELLTALRTHHGADDASYEAALQREDGFGNPGVALTKDLIRVAAQGLKEHVRLLAPRVLPLSQLVWYVYSVVAARLTMTTGAGGGKLVVPDFSTAFEHMCVHTGGKAVIEQVGRVMRLSEEATEPARMSLHRFGNTSSSLVFYELAYFEAKGRVKKGDRVWVLAFGTGFKVCSLVFRALRDSQPDEIDNPWRDCIHRYPLKAW
ncbi:hypothetical protein Scep_018681 [Stephania cephalantha]|uniref:3-ketoacyl-CoA synthase n=1 Tax=Stephania cephalantha TaxID=152367 RepID=A0AAP0I9M5_9MAGN